MNEEDKKKLPKGWEIKKLGEVANIVNGGTPKTNIVDYWDGDIRWITPADLGKLMEPTVNETSRKISELGLNKSSAKLFSENSLILSTRAPIGYLAVNQIPMCTNQGCKGIVPNNMLDVWFLYYFLKLNVKLLNDLGTGTTFKELSKTVLADIPIPLPPLSEQKRIVGILDKVFEAIDQAKADAEQNLKNAKELFESFLNGIFEKKGDDWEEKRLGEVMVLEYGKPLDKVNRVFDGIYPAYGANGIKCRSNEYYCNKKSIIVGRKGSAGEINLTEERFWPLDVTYFITFDEKKYNLMFLYFLLKRLDLPKLARGVKPGINRNDVYDILAFLPPLPIQKQIVRQLDSLRGETKKLEEIYQKKLDNLEELKKSVLQKAFAGEL